MICPNCKTQNVEGAQFCRSCGTSLTSATKWWEQYGMVPVSTFKLLPSVIGSILIWPFLIFSVLISFLGIAGLFIEGISTGDSFAITIGCIYVISGITIFIIAYSIARSKIFVNSTRKKRKELLDSDYIEYHKSRSVHHVIVARGTAHSHLFGLFDVQSIKMKLPFEYNELKWTEKGKLLSAIKDGKKFIIDINGNKYE